MFSNSLYEIDGSKILKYTGEEKNIVIPNGITEIGDYAFSSNKNIVSIAFPNETKVIGRSAFEHCDNLTSVTFGAGLNQVQSGAFGYGSNRISLVIYTGSLEDWCKIDFQTPISRNYSLIINNQLINHLIIPETVSTIREYSFYGCNILSKIFISENIVNIEKNAFSFCPNLSKIDVDENNTIYSFINGCLIDIKERSIILGTSKCQIPNDESVISIADSAFEGCSLLERIVVPSNILSIGASAFEYCTNLSEVYLPSRLAIIENSTFGDCESLQSIELPASLTKIESYAFSFCKRLECINLPEGLTELGEGAFSFCYNLSKLIFPKSLNYIETNGDDPFSCSEIEEVYYRGSEDDWKSIEIFDCGEGEDISIEDILSCNVFFNHVDEIELNEGEHNGRLIFAAGACAEYNCEDEECTIEFGEFANLTNRDVRIWIKDIGIRTPDGCEEILYEYKALCNLDEDNDYVTENLSVTIPDTAFQKYYLTPYNIDNNPYDYDLCCFELFFTLVADLGDHDIELSKWIFDATEIYIDGEFEEETDSDETGFTSADILYIYKGNIRCHKNNHNIVQATAILHSRTDNEIEINVEYCTDCNKYLLEYTLFEEYRNRYGVLIGNFRMVVNGNFDGEYDLALESPLKLSGYNVGQKDGYSSQERHYILARIIHYGIMSKGDVIRYLSYFIRMNGAKYGNELALSKWKDDLLFVQNYNLDLQPTVNITEILKY